MKKILNHLNSFVLILGSLILLVATYLFLYFNNPIINIKMILYITLTINIVLIALSVLITKRFKNRWLGLLLVLIASFTIVYSLINTVVVDYFQPLALYDLIIYITIVGFLILIIWMFINAIRAIFVKEKSLSVVTVPLLIIIFILQFYALNAFHPDTAYTNIKGTPTHIFQSGEAGYDIFRIPTMMVLPKGSTLASGEYLELDTVIVMAEARRNGSLDDGDIDLVQKISKDAGQTWSDLMVVRTYEGGVGKIGNSTPIYNEVTGEIVLLHLAGYDKTDYKTYTMTSVDGGASWSAVEKVFDGLVGPGHGIQIKNGPYEGRLIAPGYHNGGSLSIYSDDDGDTWITSDVLSDGNESEIVEINDNGHLMMVVRTDMGVAKPHKALNKLYVISTDGGTTWSDFKTNTDLKEPICMSSIVSSNGLLYYSHPDDYFSRGQMTIAKSDDAGKTFGDRKLIYQGASGYSDLGVLSDDNLILIFENGNLEYDDRITIVIVPSF